MTNNNENQELTEDRRDLVAHGLGTLVLMHLFQFPMAFFSAWIVIGLSQLI